MTRASKLLTAPGMLLAGLAAMAIVATLAGSCVQESQSARRQQTTTIPSTEPTAANSAPTSSAGSLDTTTTLPPEGLVTEKSAVKVGDCFNIYRFENERTGTSEDIFTLVDCSRPHEGEVYHQAEYQEPEFPGSAQLEEWAQQECYLHFESWVGQEYELSELDYATFLPTEATWDDPSPDSRRLSCYLASYGASLLDKSHRNSGA